MMNVKMTGAEIVRRVNILKMDRANIEAIWDKVERFIMPLRVGNMFQRPMTEQMVVWDRDEIYDSTAIHAAQNFAANIHGILTNPAYRWFDYTFKAKALRQDPLSRAWLQECTDIAYQELYDCNFDQEISSAFQDLVGLGNAFVSSEVEKEDPTDWKGFNYCAIPIKEAFFERDHRGDLYHFYRWLEWTAIEIKTKWKDDSAPIPEAIERCLKEGGNPNQRFTVIFSVYMREDKRMNLGSIRALADSERPFGAKYVLHMSGDELGDERGYYEMPVHHCPWEQTSGSIWGHGPGMVMVPTVEYINSWLELQDMAVRKQVDPPLLVRSRGLLSDLNQKPGQFTLVSDPERDVKALLTNGRVDFSQMTLKELRDMVRAAFHVDELQLRESPQMSATEAQIRYELMNRVLGPTSGRITRGMLDPLLMRKFMALLRNKQFPDIPPLVIQKKAQFKVHYSGPLVRAQSMDEVASMERFLGQLGGISKVLPKVLNVINPEKFGRALADKQNIPAEVLRSPSEVAALSNQQDAAQAALVQARIKQEQGKGGQEMAAADQQQTNGAQS